MREANRTGPCRAKNIMLRCDPHLDAPAAGSLQQTMPLIVIRACRGPQGCPD
jgi:hypothetical protein